MNLISQKYIARDGYHMAHTVTALDNGQILMSHMARDEAIALRDLLDDTIAATCQDEAA